MGHTDIVRILIQHGVDVNLISTVGIISIAKFIKQILTYVLYCKF